jgi:casein kinase II subunit beta
MEALFSGPEDEMEMGAEEEEAHESRWVRRFCEALGHEFFSAVPSAYMSEDFNWLNITYDVDAINLMLGAAPPRHLDQRGRSGLYALARRLYGLIHARWILTDKGLVAMREKYERGDFGRCPRVACRGQHVLPLGLSDEPDPSVSSAGDREENAGVKVYCPRCRQLYHPGNSYHRGLDGAWWGTSFVSLFLLAFPDLRFPWEGGDTRHEYQLTIHGFRLRQPLDDPEPPAGG